jgi:subtilisin family serine protease
MENAAPDGGIIETPPFAVKKTPANGVSSPEIDATGFLLYMFPEPIHVIRKAGTHPMHFIRSFFTLCLLILTLLAAPAQADPFVPNDPYFPYNTSDDYKYFPGQWYLQNQAPSEITVYVKSKDKNITMKNAFVDANLKGAWDLGYTGKGVVIGIVDDGVEGTHEDLKENYNAKLSRSFQGGKILETQGPVLLKDNHGTSVAGVAAARGGNKIGGTGAAPYATIAGLRLLSGSQTDEDEFNAILWGSGVAVTIDPVKKTFTFTTKSKPEIAVQNHSYSAKAPFVDEEDIILQALSKTAANGVIHVFSAGNERGEAGEDTGKKKENSFRGVINVAALGSDGKYADYSSYGASVFITAPSNRSDYTAFGVTTTDRTGDDFGYNKYSDDNTEGDQDDAFPKTSYTATFGGTSSSAPLVSGIMALGKEANPLTDVRTAKHLLVLTGTKVDATDKEWVKNGAGNFFSPHYGFGNINAGKFVEAAKKVLSVTPQTSYTSGTKTFGEPEKIKHINSDGTGGTSATLKLTTAELPATLRQPLEGVEVGLNFTHPSRGDLTASVTSPYATKSTLFYSTSSLPAEKQDKANVENFSWTFLTNALWGEDPLGGTDKTSGIWTITMGDTVGDKVGAWNSYGLTLLMGKINLSSGGTTTQTTDIKAQYVSLQDKGELFKNQAGTTLTVSQKVMVEAGEMNINGKVAMSTREPDDEDPEDGWFVLDGGIVSGAGIIDAPYGFYHVSGDLKPGNSIGTLTINGDYVQDSQGKLLIEVASPAASDLLAVNGSADLSGILQTSWMGVSIPAAKTKFGTFLTASLGITGQFSVLETRITLTLYFKPKYEVANQIYLQVERDYNNAFLASNLSANQRAAGTALNSVADTATGDLDAVLSAIDNQTSTTGVAASLEQIAPRGDMASSFISMSGARMQSGNIAGRLQDVRSGVRGVSLRGLSLVIEEDREFNLHGKPIVLAFNGDTLPAGFRMGEKSEKWGFFATGNGTTGNIRDDSSQTDSSFRNAGLTLGGDYRFSEHLAAGLMAGYNRLWTASAARP